MTTKQLILASELAYLDDVSQSKLQALPGWKPIASFVNGDTGYAGVAFLTPDGEVVVAHGGTHPRLDGTGDFEDDVLLGLNRMPTQFEDAKHLMREAQQYVDEKGISATFHHTGHSLGGGLAQMCAHQFDQQATTFEAPAMKEILEKMDVEHKLDPSDFDLYAVRGSWISSEHSIVPHSHVHENVNYLDLELPDDLHKFGWTGKDKFSFDFHGIENFKKGIAENGNIDFSYHNPAHLEKLLSEKWKANETWGTEMYDRGVRAPTSLQQHFGDYESFKKYYLEKHATELGLPTTKIEYVEGSEIVVDKNLWMEIQIKIERLETAVNAI